MIHNTTSRKCTTPEVKSAILARLSSPGSSVSKLAKDYNIPVNTIYGWQAQERTVKKCTMGKESTNFVEISVVEQAPKAASLQKASLVFADFSFTLEGKIEAGVLLEIMKILEASSC